MSRVTVSQAATLTGVSRETINKATRKGRLTYTLNSSNHKVIDVAELERVFPLVKSIEDLSADAEAVSQPQAASDSDATVELALLKEKLAGSEQAKATLLEERHRERRQLEEEIESLKATLDRTHEQHTRALAVITDQSKEDQDREAEWARFMEGVENRLTQQEERFRAEQEKLRNSAKQRIKRLQDALEEEQAKSWLAKLFG